MIRENGPAENLKFETDFPTPKVADGQVLVKNEYTGINFIDTYFRKGGPAYTQQLPFVSGQVPLSELCLQICVLQLGSPEDFLAKAI